MKKTYQYYENRLARLKANGETMNMRIINKIKRKMRAMSV